MFKDTKIKKNKKLKKRNFNEQKISVSILGQSKKTFFFRILHRTPHSDKEIYCRIKKQHLKFKKIKFSDSSRSFYAEDNLKF